MSSYMTEQDARDYFGGLKSRPDITFTTRDTKVYERLLKQFGKNETLHVNIQGWCGAVYVIALNWKAQIDDITEYTATLRPTGRPTSRPDALVTPSFERLINRTYDTVDVKLPMRFRKDYVEMAMAPLEPKQLQCTRPPGFLLGGPKYNPKKKETPVKIRNKYYVAAAKVSTELEQAQDNVSGKVSLANGSGTNTRGYGENTGRWTRKDLKGAVEHAEQILEANPSQEHVVIVKMVRIVRRKKAPLVVEVL